MMRFLLTPSLLLAGVVSAQAAFTYVDASSGLGNTTLANGSAFSPPLNGTNGVDNNWEQRTTFGSGGNIFESGGETAGEDAPELRTTISGLTAGTQYTIYVHFWDPTSTTEDWNVRAGLTSNAGANTLYSAADATLELGGSTAAVLASTLTFSTGPTLFAESGRALLAGLIGTATADSNGQIFVFVDDLPTVATVNQRTWYDGVSYEAVPEPSAVALLALGGLLVARRRRA